MGVVHRLHQLVRVRQVDDARVHVDGEEPGVALDQRQGGPREPAGPEERNRPHEGRARERRLEERVDAVPAQRPADGDERGEAVVHGVMRHVGVEVGGPEAGPDRVYAGRSRSSLGVQEIEHRGDVHERQLPEPDPPGSPASP